MQVHFHESSEKAKVILRRIPLVSPSLLSLIEPSRVKESTTELSTFWIPIPPPPAPVWSPELECLYNALDCEEWNTLASERLAMLEKVYDLRKQHTFFYPNTSERGRILAEADEVCEGFLD